MPGERQYNMKKLLRRYFDFLFDYPYLIAILCVIFGIFVAFEQVAIYNQPFLTDSWLNILTVLFIGTFLGIILAAIVLRSLLWLLER